jgi:predicted AlkP superfamily pyrophosphatase or phosphodiesterase
MTRRARVRLAVWISVIFACGIAHAKPTVIVLSWDGVRHDQPDRRAFAALGRMERDGVRAERLVPVAPPSTFPAHVSMATGTHPDRHGILGNRFVDRERGLYRNPDDASWIEAEPVWIAAERQGVRSAVFYWVGAESDWRGARATYRVTPFSSKTTERAKVDRIIDWLGLPEPERPHLVMSWWQGADRVGHRHGPDSEAVVERLAEQDAELGRLFAFLDREGRWPETTVIVVSDHGMSAGIELLWPEQALASAGIPAFVADNGGMAHVYLEDGSAREAARPVLEALPGTTVYATDEIPERLRLNRPGRIGDFLLVAEPPRAFRRPKSSQRIGLRLSRLLERTPGVHGYDPENPDMAGIFLALGRRVEPGAALGAVQAIDVAPTITALLGIEPPRDSEGVARLGAAPDGRP